MLANGRWDLIRRLKGSSFWAANWRTKITDLVPGIPWIRSALSSSVLAILICHCTSVTCAIRHIFEECVYYQSLRRDFVLHSVDETRTYTAGYATTNECYNEQFLSIKSGCYNEHICYNERGGIYYRPTLCALAHDVSGLPALIPASVIIFVIVCRVQLSV